MPQRSSAGERRSWAAADIRAKKYPLSIELIIEEWNNAERHHATKFRVEYHQTPEGDFDMITICNGDGEADVSRLTAAAETSGSTTSMYGKGLEITREKRGKPGDPFSASWKRKGRSVFHRFSNIEEGTEAHELDELLSPWSAREEHGFQHKTVLRSRKLQTVGDIQGVTIKDLAMATRETICVHTSQGILDRVTIEVKVYDAAGVEVSSMNSKCPTDPWVSFVEECEKSKDCIVSPPISTVISGIVSVDEVKTSEIKVGLKFMHKKIPAKKSMPNFPRWGVTSMSWCFIEVFGFYIPVPLYEVLGKKQHGSSLNGRIAAVTIEGDLKDRPTPASTRTSFRQDCLVYQELQKRIQGLRPHGWDDWTPRTPTPPPAPAPLPAPVPAPAPQDEEWIETPHGRSIRNEMPRNAGETDKEYVKRIKNNRSSRNSKAKKTSRSSSISSEPAPQTEAVVPPIQIPALPASPRAPAYETDVRAIVGTDLSEEKIQALLALIVRATA